MGNGSFAWLSAMQVRSYYSCISLLTSIEISLEFYYQVLYNEHISSNTQLIMVQAE